MRMRSRRWKLGWKRCDCVKCEASITIEQTQENCGWIMWADHKDEVIRLKNEINRLRKMVKIADDAVDCVIQVHDYGFEKINTEYVSWLKRNWESAKNGKKA